MIFMKKIFSAILCVALVLPLLTFGQLPWKAKETEEILFEDSFNYESFDDSLYDSTNVWQAEYKGSEEDYGYYDSNPPEASAGSLQFEKGDGVRLNWTNLEGFTFDSSKTYTLTFDVKVTDFGDNTSMATLKDAASTDKTMNRELFFGIAGYYNQIEMRSGRTPNDTGSTPKPLGIRTGNNGTPEVWSDISAYQLNTVYTCIVEWIPGEKKVVSTVKNGDTVVGTGSRIHNDYGTLNKYSKFFVFRCEDGAMELDNLVFTDGSATYEENFAFSDAMSASGLWGLEDVVKTDTVAPTLENGVLKMTDKNSVRFNWTNVPNVGEYDSGKVYTFEFDFNITDSGDGSLWSTKNYTRALYVAFGGYYTVLEMNSTDGLVKCPDNDSDTYTEAKYAKQTLRCKIVWEGTTFSVAVYNAQGTLLFSGARTNKDFTDMAVQNASMTNLVLRCEDGAVSVDNFKFTAKENQSLYTSVLEIPTGNQGVYQTKIHYNGTEKVSVKLGANEVFSIDPLALKLCAKTVPGTYSAGDYNVTIRVNPEQEMVTAEVVLPDGGMIRKGLSSLLGSTTVSVYSTNSNGASAPTIGYEAITVQSYQLTETEPQATGFGANVYNLVTSFSDAATTRAFAWTAKTEFLNGDGMALQYRVSGTNDWTTVDAVQEVESIETADEDYFKCDITGLAANTTYEYRIGKKNSQNETDDWSKVYTFKTASGNETEFTFLAVGDTQGKTWSGLTSADKGFMFAKAAFDAAFAENSDPAFILHAGDVVETGGDKALWNMYFKTLGEHGASTPHFATLGNHDTWTYGNPFYFDYHFNHPDNGGSSALDQTQIDKITNSDLLNVIEHIDETIYSYDYGNAHFIVLNTGSYNGQDEYLIEAQRQWLINDLQANQDAEWTVMLFHEPVYHRLGGTESRPWLYDVIEGYGVDLVLQGHSHLVTRTYPMKNGQIVTKSLTDTIPKGTGTIYATIGSTALNHDGTGDAKQVEEMFTTITPTATQPAYTFVTVENDRLTVTTKQVNGLVLDQYSIVSESSDELKSEQKDLTVQYTELTPADKVYSLDITWENDDVAFEYVGGKEGTWNPTNHTFEGVEDAKWLDRDLKVTVVNHSNAGVKATLTVADQDADDQLLVTPESAEEVLATAEDTSVANAPKAEFTLTINGTPTGDVDRVSTVARATITLTQAD